MTATDEEASADVGKAEVESETDKVDVETVEAAEAEEVSDTEDSSDTEKVSDAEKDAGTQASENSTVPQRRWPRKVLAGVVALVFVGALAVSGVLGWLQWQDRQVAQAGQQAQEAAVAYAQVLTSIDSSKVDENFNQVLDGATGEFKDMYSQSSVQLRQLLIDNKASARGVVVDSAIQSESKDKVVVLLFVDQSVSNSSVPDPRIDRSRIKMTMEFVDGRWRASQVALP